MLAAEISAAAVMSLLPRWQFMTDESKALVTRTAISVGVVVLAALALRTLLPWVVLVVLLWLVGSCSAAVEQLPLGQGV